MNRLSLKSLNKIIGDLQNGADKISKGSLPSEEIVSLIESTRLLYEKLVILQYLAEKKYLMLKITQKIKNKLMVKIKLIF